MLGRQSRLSILLAMMLLVPPAEMWLGPHARARVARGDHTLSHGLWAQRRLGCKRPAFIRTGKASRISFVRLRGGDDGSGDGAESAVDDDGLGESGNRDSSAELEEGNDGEGEVEKDGGEGNGHHVMVSEEGSGAGKGRGKVGRKRGENSDGDGVVAGGIHPSRLDPSSVAPPETPPQPRPLLEVWEESPGVNITDAHQLSMLLIKAALAGRVNDAKALVACGADPNFVAPYDEAESAECRVGWRPLLYAAAHGRTATCSALIRLGANTSLGDEYRATALHAAADRGKTATVSALIDMGCDVAALTHPANFTALHYAAMRGFSGTVLCLLRMGADINAKSKFGDDASEMARTCDEERLHRMLEEFKSRGSFSLMPQPSKTGFVAGAFTSKRQRSEEEETDKEQVGEGKQREAHEGDAERQKGGCDKRPRFFDGEPSRPSLLDPPPLRDPPLRDPSVAAAADVTHGVTHGYASPAPTFAVPSFGLSRRPVDGTGVGGGGVRAMVEDQRRRLRYERQEEIRQGMLVPGKVVMRNVPYNMKEETMKALISAEGLPDPREVQFMRNPQSQHFCMVFVQFPHEVAAERAIELFNKRSVSDDSGAPPRMLYVAQFYQIDRNPHGESRARESAAEGWRNRGSAPALGRGGVQHFHHPHWNAGPSTASVVKGEKGNPW